MLPLKEERPAWLNGFGEKACSMMVVRGGLCSGGISVDPCNWCGTRCRHTVSSTEVWQETEMTRWRSQSICSCWSPNMSLCNDCLVPVSLLGVCSFFKRASASWIDVLSSFFDQSCLTACGAKNRPLEKSLSSSAAERFVWGTVKHRLIEEQSCVLLSLV